MFLPARLIARLRKNVKSNPEVARIAAAILKAAEPWLRLSDDELWRLMFGPTLTRSWDVFSTGFCPSCRKDTPLYSWKINALLKPWKVCCPHCRDVFPKNDFGAFYRSGLDEHSIFDYGRADRALLFNCEHPGRNDPRRTYGVDDGEGYLDQDGHRWRFVGTYLMYGQWKQMVLGGINSLTAAWLVSAQKIYAHKAAILLDRVADLYPSFDHIKQAWVHGEFRTDGYVSTWHDACEETRMMALSYDAMREVIAADKPLASFLAEKAARFKLANPKRTGADVCRNIENGILRDPLKNPHKTHSNYPRQEIAFMVIHGALRGAKHRAEMNRILKAVLEQATAVDGVTGEKGLSAYSSYVIQSLAVFLALMERAEPGALLRLIRQHPRLAQTWRFFLDTWCGNQQYYPQVGDCTHFAGKKEEYAGLPSTAHRMPIRRTAEQARSSDPTALLNPSMFSFLWKLYEATGDAAYAQLIYHINGRSMQGLPQDLFAANPRSFQTRLRAALKMHGADFQLGNVLKADWHLAILRSGTGAHERAAWLTYDTGGRHSHCNALNLGLFAKGLDLMPDFGYPPLQFSGSHGPHATWYLMTAAHNTVVINGRNQPWPYSPLAGRCTLWADGQSIAAVRASCSELLSRMLTPLGRDLSADHEVVGLYFSQPATVYNFKVYAKPEPPWMLCFEDKFDRAELGPDWRVLSGEWKVERGCLKGQGELLCTKYFRGSQRLEFEASSGERPAGGLGAFLAADETGHLSGVLYLFGSRGPERSRLILAGQEVARSAARPISNKRYRLRCEREAEMLRHYVDGRQIQSFRNKLAPARAGGKSALRGLQYERTLIKVDISETDSYYADIFRVAGGEDHAKFMHSHFARLTTAGLSLAPGEPFGNNTLMRNFITDKAPQMGWRADWRVEDRHNYLPPGAQVHLRYTDLSCDVEVSTCEGWVAVGNYNTRMEAWIPRIMLRRKSAPGKPLSSTFAGIIEPYQQTALITACRRLPLEAADGRRLPNSHVAIEISLTDGGKDLIIAADVENPSGRQSHASGELLQQDWNLRLRGEMCVVHRDSVGRLRAVALAKGRRLQVGDFSLKLKAKTDFIEVHFHNGRPQVVSGPAGLAEITS